MKGYVVLVTVALGSATLSIPSSAQSGTQTQAAQSGTQTQPAQSQTTQDELHVAGCVVREQGKIVLTKATLVGVASRTKAMPSASGADASAPIRSYELRGTDVDTFVDQQAEVTGTLETPATTASPSAGKDDSKPTMSILRVKSVKGVSAQCSR